MVLTAGLDAPVHRQVCESVASEEGSGGDGRRMYVRIGDGPGQEAGGAGGPSIFGGGFGQARADAPAAEVRGDGEECQFGRAAVVLESEAVEAAWVRGQARPVPWRPARSEEHTSELQSRQYLVCR